ncbi:uncharacterized protein [Temnothorax nylanderi]
MAKNAHKPEKALPCCSAVEHPELISLSEERRNLISVANKVFGEGKWSHTVVKQTLDFDDVDSDEVDSDEVDSDDEYFDDEINARNKYRTKCVSYIKIQLENGNCYEDDGFYITEESTKGLSIQTVRIGSAINALFRVLLSFGDKVERELKQLRRQIGSEEVNTFAAAEPMDLAMNFHDLISVANKVFGEGKWNHTVVSQTLDFIDMDNMKYAAINAQDKYRTGCVSSVKVELENGNFHEDIGYYNAEELTEGLSIQNARIGSAVNALKRVLLSFGDKIERELQQLQRQISSEQGNDVQRDAIQSLGKQISQKSNVSVKTFATAKSMDLAADFFDLISAANKVFGEGKWNHTVVSQTLNLDCENYATLNAPHVYHTGCVSFVKVQLESGNFHQDVGYFNAEALTEGLSLQNARIGSAVNALKRVLLSFGDKVERELQQLRRQIGSEQVNTFAAAEPMDLAINFHDLISAANKVFGEGKWNHTVVRQILDFNDVDFDDVDFGDVDFDDADFDDVIDREINARNKYCAGCVSYVKIQLENGNFHEDIGYFNAEQFTEGLAIQNARIGSAVNALKRVLLSFGDKIERELQQLQRQISSEQVKTFAAAEPTDLTTNFLDLISAANKVFGEGNWSHTVVKQTLDFDDTDSDEADFDDLDFDEEDDYLYESWVLSAHRHIIGRNKYYTGCVSYVKVQLKNRNFHEDVGYFNAEEPTRGLSIHNARIGSAVNALKRVLLSFGEKIERELQQLQRQVVPKQVRDTKRDVTSSLVNTIEPMDLIVEFPDLISAANRVFGEGKWSHTLIKQTLDFDDVDSYDIDSDEIDSDDEDFDDIIHNEINIRNKYFAGCVSYVKVQVENGNFHEDVGYCSTEEPTRGLSILNAKIGSAVNALKRVLLSFGEKVERELQRQIRLEQTNDVQDVTQSLDKQISEKLNVSDPTLVLTVNNDITETDPSSFVKVQSSKIVQPSPNKTNFTSE